MENAPNSNLFITTTYVLLGWLRFVVSYGCDCVALPCRGFAFTFTFTFQCRSESPLPVFYRRVSLTTCFALAAYNNIAWLVQMYSLCQLHRRIICFKYVFNGFVIEKCQKKNMLRTKNLLVNTRNNCQKGGRKRNRSVAYAPRAAQYLCECERQIERNIDYNDCTISSR